ncbi:MAG: hypothetical protein J6I80_05245 [Clostridia bacterium]|nr:hypothetical protein [Clostridia bacterium]
MKDIKRYWFWRAVLVSTVIFGCTVFLLAGSAAVYEGIAKTGRFEYEQAVCIDDGCLIVFGKKISGLE